MHIDSMPKGDKIVVAKADWKVIDAQGVLAEFSARKGEEKLRKAGENLCLALAEFVDQLPPRTEE